MANVYWSTLVYYVYGAKWYHPIPSCTTLEREIEHDVQWTQRAAHQITEVGHVDLCPECREKLRSMPESLAPDGEEVICDVHAS